MKRIVITGAAGSVAQAVIEALQDDQELILLDRETDAERDIRGAELADYGELLAAMPEADVLIHLGAIPNEADPHAIVESNVRGTVNAFEAARVRGVKRLVFTSTVQTYNAAMPSEKGCIARPETHTRPNTYYAVSKIFGEQLGCMYHVRHGLSVVCIRLGWFLRLRDRFDESRLRPPRPFMLSVEDCKRVFRRAALADFEGYAIVHGMSRCAEGYFDLAIGRETIGFDPVDDGEEAIRQHVERRGRNRA